VVQEAADRAARRIATLGRVDEEVLQEAIDTIGASDLSDEEHKSAAQRK
jgi:hypothetical protein